MPSFRPFRALRYAPDRDLGAVTAPPYDVLGEDDLAELTARDPYNIVHVDVPSGLPGSYDEAAATLAQWVSEGVLVRDDKPSFTIYRMAFTDATGSPRRISGVVGALSVHDYDEREVLPHERITPKASTDRLDLTRATRANLSPVWGLSPSAGLTQVLGEPGEPLGSVVVDGVTHTVERVTDPDRVAAIAEAVEREAVLIADGHHRYGVAQDYLREQTASGDTTGADSTLVYVNELVADQLSLDAIHRLYSGVPLPRLRAALEESFELSPGPTVTEAVLAEMTERACLLLVCPDGTSSWLSPRTEAFPGVRDIDGAKLEHALAEIDATVTYQHGVDRVMEALATGEFTAAVLIRPTSVDEIMVTVREGLLMPPKSTFFTPKLLTGLLVREIA